MQMWLIKTIDQRIKILQQRLHNTDAMSILSIL